jgi:hypothetical protein
VRADRRTKRYALAAIGCEVAAVTVGLVNNLTGWFSHPLIDLSRMLAAVGLVLVGAAAESIRRLNSPKP